MIVMVAVPVVMVLVVAKLVWVVLLALNVADKRWNCCGGRHDYCLGVRARALVGMLQIGLFQCVHQLPMAIALSLETTDSCFKGKNSKVRFG